MTITNNVTRQENSPLGTMMTTAAESLLEKATMTQAPGTMMTTAEIFLETTTEESRMRATRMTEVA